MISKQTGGIGLIVVLAVAGLLILGGFNYYGFSLLGEDEMGLNGNAAAVGYRDVEGGDQVENTATKNETNATAASDSEVAFTLNLGNLSSEQRAILKLRGIEGDEIQVTGAMVKCAEGKLGSDRMRAIRSGADLSMTEQVQLLACYE